MRAFLGSVLRDVKLTFRDPLLAVMPLAPLLASAAMRFLLPLADSLARREAGVELLGTYGNFIAAVLAGFPGMFLGMTGGFLLLDDRDEGILAYQEAGPLGRGGYLLSRLAFLFAASFALGPVCVAMAGVGKPGPEIFLVSFLGAFQAPLFALCIAAFSDNKVEGLALAKAMGTLDLVPLALLLPEPARFLGMPFFQFWGCSLVHLPAGAAALPWSLGQPLAFAIGTALAALSLAIAYRAFRRRVE